MPDGFLLFVVRYSLVPGGRLAKFAKLLTGNCSVAITEVNANSTKKNLLFIFSTNLFLVRITEVISKIHHRVTMRTY